MLDSELVELELIVLVLELLSVDVLDSVLVLELETEDVLDTLLVELEDSVLVLDSSSELASPNTKYPIHCVALPLPDASTINWKPSKFQELMSIA